MTALHQLYRDFEDLCPLLEMPAPPADKAFAIFYEVQRAAQITDLQICHMQPLCVLWVTMRMTTANIVVILPVLSVLAPWHGSAPHTTKETYRPIRQDLSVHRATDGVILF